MDELDLITGVRPDAPLLAADDLAEARRTLTAGLMAARATSERRRPAGHRTWRTRPRQSVRLGAVVTGAVAAGAALALVLTSALSAGRAHLPAGRGHRPGAATLTAVQFLTAAAAATRAGHGVAPRPDQYVYTDNVSPRWSGYEEWLSADGSRPGLITGTDMPAAGEVLPACTAARAAAHGCSLAAGYLPELPANASDVLAYLAELNVASASAPAGQDTPNWLANDTGKAVAELMSTTYLLPGQQSALFQLLAQTPGFRLVPNAEDALGRGGTGIYWAYEGGGAMIVFDSVSYRYLGFGTWPVGQGPTTSGRPVVAPDGTALAAMAIVDAERRSPRPSATLTALFRQAEQWAVRQHRHRPWPVAAALAAYLRQVRHMSPGRIGQILAELGFRRAAAPVTPAPAPASK